MRVDTKRGQYGPIFTSYATSQTQREEVVVRVLAAYEAGEAE